MTRRGVGVPAARVIMSLIGRPAVDSWFRQTVRIYCGACDARPC